ncbi:uncharacterized protein EDB93DRAFT_1102369 [Suillus bovinus]|uniref:uncharacterized protein n=1 Tax=Suillus bovinus TaxID=48563 RepID=UPI001B874818|nr:uncharacterized protein EDB93DRAFT_1102369 [Suillus bovinus]KAG2154228.1 hypothetical protein EDB93DRAFT_1102369 [Suillus bovinus]
MSTPASALPPLIDLSMGGMEPNPPNLQDDSAIDGLIFELNQIQPEVSQMPGEIVKPDDLGNLFPEYDSVEEMDVQVKGEPSVCWMSFSDPQNLESPETSFWAFWVLGFGDQKMTSSKLLKTIFWASALCIRVSALGESIISGFGLWHSALGDSIIRLSALSDMSKEIDISHILASIQFPVLSFGSSGIRNSRW